jgi:molybdopterin molybdotransferase
VKEGVKPGLMSVDDALSHLLGAASAVAEIETVDTIASAGRVLAAAQVSTIDVPGMDTSMMDGYAVRVADTAAAMKNGRSEDPAPLPVSQRIPAGQVGTALASGTVARIFTGAIIPAGADAVVMQEACEVVGDAVKVRATPRDGEWITRQGADIGHGRQILEKGVKLRAQDAGLAASVGLAQLPVYRRLKVAVFFTGDELVMPGEKLPPGAIYNSNRFVLNALLRQSGCDVTDFGIVPDRLDATREVLRKAATGHDLILTSGGVSVGEEDHVRPAVEAEGKLSMWRIAMKPGRPLAFGHVGQGDRPAAFIGLPGNPVSSFVTFLIFVRPFILKSQGVRNGAVPVQAMRADFDWTTPDARREFMRVKLNAAGGLDLFPNQASAVLTSTVWADGLIDNPERHVIKRGDLVRYMPFSALFE